MKYLDWNDEKDALLKEERGIGLADVLAALEAGNLLADLRHTNQKYPHQNVFVVQVLNYAYLVPYVEDEEKIFLKTVIPSRVATKRYMKGDLV